MAAYQQSKQELDFDDGQEAKFSDVKASQPATQASSAFGIAVAVANAAEVRIQTKKELRAEAKMSGGDSTGGSGEKDSGYRLLGELPSLGPRSNREEVKIALSLELPNDSARPKIMVLTALIYLDLDHIT